MTTTAATDLSRSGSLSRRTQRVVRQGQGKVLIPALLLVVMLVGTTLFYVWCRLQAVRLGYEQSRTTETLHRVEKENEELRGEVARLKSPERIERLARDQLGLLYPSPEQIHILDLPGE